MKMNKIFITLDPILDVNPMAMAEWCASMPKSPENAPVDISMRWKHHVNDNTEIDNLTAGHDFVLGYCSRRR